MMVRQAISDGRSVAARAFVDGERDRFRVVAVDAGRMPARGAEALELVVGHREAGRAVDGDLIVVEQHDQAAELEVTGERDRLLADALHEAAVAGDHVGVVIDDLIAVARVEQPLGERHADGVAEPLPERTGGGLDARRMAIFGMARRSCEPSWRKRFSSSMSISGIAGEIEQRIEQHRAVAGREHEAVAVGPIRMARRRISGSA